jgi:hypothetical protein
VLETTQEYRNAIIAGTRRIVPLAVMDLIDPDIIYEDVTSSELVPYSNGNQLFDKNFEAVQLASLENNYWILDGSMALPPETETDTEVGAVFSPVAEDGTTDVYAELNLSNLGILQTASVHFTGHSTDGAAEDFTFTIYSGDTVAYTETVTGNRESVVEFSGFTVYNATKIRVDVTKWSFPGRRPRIVEIVPGLYIRLDGATLSQVDVLHETAFDNMRVPNGTATLEILNEDKRFNPFHKSSLFLSIESRQGFPISFGIKTPSGIEYLPLGVFYQQDGGWQTDAYGATIRFSLTDIIGLLKERTYEPPSTLPTTLSGWIQSIVSHLGENFIDKFTVDASISDTAIQTTAERLGTPICGDVLRHACMAAGAFFRADAATGYLRVSPLSDIEGARVSLDNMYTYPSNAANSEVADVTYKLDGDTTYTVMGTLSTSGNSLTVDNPFIHTQAQANEATKAILLSFGGFKFTVNGRGDMRSELGDIDTLETGFDREVAARRYKQQFKLGGGVMSRVPSEFIQAGGAVTFNNRVELTATSGTWTAPAGVEHIKLILVSGGQGGEDGAFGQWGAAGESGAGGQGGRAFAAGLAINPGQMFTYSIGQGGLHGEPGQATTFGPYTSDDGNIYEGGWGDIYTGYVYGLPGSSQFKGYYPPYVGKDGAPNTGAGGQGGGGGRAGIEYYNEETWSMHVSQYPREGGPGGRGGSGLVVIYYNT